MKIPSSDLFTPLALNAAFTNDRDQLDGTLAPLNDTSKAFGDQDYLGIPFSLGPQSAPNVLLLDQNPIQVDAGGAQASYILFLHRVEDRPTNYQDGFAQGAMDGNELGDHVADYALHYQNGETASVPVLRRFAIQQSHIGWGASAFAAVPAMKPVVFLTNTEDNRLGRKAHVYGRGETRHGSPRDSMGEKLWIYALPNPHPEKPIAHITCTPQTERALIYAITLTQIEQHPLRPGVRRKTRLTLPDGVELNGIGELDGVDIDLGTVISSRAVLQYDPVAWASNAADVQPTRLEREVVIEYSAHPQAKLYVATGKGDDDYQVYTLPGSNGAIEVAPAHRPVTLKIVDKASGQAVAARLHLHGQSGEYLPPKGYHRKVNPNWFEDNYGEFVAGHNQYCYIPGECVADLPLGEVFVHISRGYEIQPIRASVTVTADTDELTFELERVLDWRSQGWVTADTHVHFLSPTTARLEGEGEGVNVVNLLASQWGEMFSNVTDFDGQTTLGAKDLGGNGEFLVRVGTENRMQSLGHISLLGYSGAMIHPLCSGGPSESAIGDPQELTMAEWAEQCIKQNGLVVMPHAPNPQCERAADIVLGLVHAVEMMVFNPLHGQLNPYGIADWYRYLNLGYHVPVVGGSDKMSAASQLGGVRTYAQLNDRELTYENWMEAVKSGNTFVTVGPLAVIQVEGQAPGSRIDLPGSGGSVTVSWKAESVSVPIDQVEIIVGGLAVEQANFDKALKAEGSAQVKIESSSWIALRVRGSYKGTHGELAAHTSAVQVVVENQPLFSKQDAMTVLEQIEGAIAYVDTIAPRPEAQRYKQLRATLESAHNRLHQRLHQHGVFHEHTPLHDHGHSHEH
jgi:hypothetical protein